MRGAGDLSARHARHEERADGKIAVGIDGEALIADGLVGVGSEPCFELGSELRPRIGEAFEYLARARGDGERALGSMRIFAFAELGIAAHLPDHPVRRAGDDERVDRVVQVAVFAYLFYAPALAHIARYHAADGGDVLLSAGDERRELEIVRYVVEQERGHMLRVLKIALLEALFVLFGQLFL